MRSALLTFAFAACATTPTPPADQPNTKSGFPTKRSLEEIQRTPLPNAADATRYLDVEGWDLTGPFPDGDPSAVRAPEKAWDALVDQAVAARPGSIASVAMQCAAREFGLFYAAKHAYPAPSLQAFVLARCGATIPLARLAWLGGEAREDMSDDRIFEQWRDRLTGLIAAVATDPNAAIGLWFGRQGKEALFFVASGPVLAELDRFGALAEPQHYLLEGRVFSETSYVRALINRGSFGAADCRVSSERERFSIDCEASPDDDYAWIEIAAFPPGRILGKTVLNAIVFPKGAPVNRYVRASVGEARPIAGTEDIRAGLLAAINQIRQTAGMKPLVLDLAQSAIAASLAGHFFAALLGRLPGEIADRILLGMRAGWDVEGLVKYGKLTSAFGALDTTVGYMTSTAIDRPFGRDVLLDPDVRRLAIGPIIATEGGFSGAMLGTYALFDADLDKAPTTLALELLAQRRSEAGRDPPRQLEIADIPRRVAEMVANGSLAPRAALDWYMSQTSLKTKLAVRGWVLEVSELDRLDFPQELLLTPGVELSIAVSHAKPADEPWARYVVLIVMSEPLETI